MSCQYVVGCSLANVLLFFSPLPSSTFRLSFTIVTSSCSEPKPVAFLTSTIILFSILLGVLLGLLCGWSFGSEPQTCNAFFSEPFYHSLQLTFLLLLIMYAASCLVILIRSLTSVLTTAWYRFLTISDSFFNMSICHFSKYTSPCTIIIDFHFFVYCEGGVTHVS